MTRHAEAQGLFAGAISAANGTRFHLLGDSTIVFAQGNLIVAIDRNGSRRALVEIEAGYTLDTFVLHQRKQLLLCGIHGIATQIRGYALPDFSLQFTLPVSQLLSISQLATSADGTRIAAVCTVGEPVLAVWSTEHSQIIAEYSADILLETCFLSFNPTNNDELVTVASGNAFLWTIDGARLGQKRIDLGTDVQTKRHISPVHWSASGKLFIGTSTGEVRVMKQSESSKAKRASLINRKGSVAKRPTLPHITFENTVGTTLVCLPNTSSRSAITAITSINSVVVAAAENGQVYWILSDSGRVAHNHRFVDITQPADNKRQKVFSSQLEVNESGNTLLGVDCDGVLHLAHVSLSSDGSSVTVRANTITQQLVAAHFDGSDQLAARCVVLPFQSGSILKSYLLTQDTPVSAVICGPSKGGYTVLGRYSLQQHAELKDAQVVHITAHTHTPVCAVGYTNGCVAVYDFSSVCVERSSDAPKAVAPIFVERVHEGAVHTLRFSRNGSMLCTLGRDDRMCLFDAHTQGLLNYLGCIELSPLTHTNPDHTSASKKNRVVSWFCTHTCTGESKEKDNTTVPVCGCGSRLLISNANGEATVFSVPAILAKTSAGQPFLLRAASPAQFDSAVETISLPQDIVALQPLYYNNSSAPAHISKNSSLTSPSFNSLSPKSPRTSTPVLVGVNTSNRAVIVSGQGFAVDALKLHNLGTLGVAVAPDAKSIAFGGADGQVKVYFPNDLNTPVLDFSAHGIGHRDGASYLSFSADNKQLFSASEAGAVSVWELQNVSAVGSRSSVNTLSVLQNTSKGPHSGSLNKSGRLSKPKDTQITVPPAAPRQASSAEHNTVRNDLEQQLTSLRTRFEALVQRNTDSKEIDQLNRQEFALDNDLTSSLQNQADKAADEARSAVFKQNMGSQLVWARLKEACWDTMKEKQRAFLSFDGNTELLNMPIRAPTHKETLLQKKVMFLRRLELMEQKWHAQSAPANPAEAEHEFAPEKLVANGASFIDGDLKFANTTGAGAVAAGANDAKEADSKKAPSTLDDLRTPEKLLYPAASAVTVARKCTQIYLIRACIAQRVELYNKAFQDMYDLKAREIEKINERHKRICTIRKELNQAKPTLSFPTSGLENPEDVLKLPEGYENSNKSSNLAVEQNQESVDLASRALSEMMGGTLETSTGASKVEEELVREEWMDLPVDKLTDEQRTALAAFEKRRDTLRNEKETRRKVLETEANKLNNDIADIMRVFDMKLVNFVEKRLKTQSLLHQMKLRCFRLVLDVSEDQHANTTLVEQHSALQRIRESIAANADIITTKQAELDDAVALHDNLNNEEKSNERRLKLELKETCTEGDHLMDLYRHVRVKRNRPRNSITEQSAAATLAESSVPRDLKIGLIAPLRRPSLMSKSKGKRPSTITINDANKAAEVKADEFEELLDEDRPESVPFEIWDDFVLRRKTHHLVLQQLALKKNAIAEQKRRIELLNAERAHWQERETTVQSLIDTIVSTQHSDVLNTEVLVRCLQGQLEVPEAPVVTDMDEATLCLRSIIDELNTSIVAIGTDNVDQLTSIVAERRKIRFVQWTKQVKEFELYDTGCTISELQLLRVTKQLQRLIKSDGDEGQSVEGALHADKKKEYLQKLTEQKVAVLSKTLEKIRVSLETKLRENGDLRKSATKLEESVAGRIEINHMREREHVAVQEEYQAKLDRIFEQRRLTELLRLQSDEMVLLQDEVTNLRQKTFAAFPQPLPPYPDLRDEREMDNKGQLVRREGERSGARSVMGTRGCEDSRPQSQRETTRKGAVTHHQFGRAASPALKGSTRSNVRAFWAWEATQSSMSVRPLSSTSGHVTAGGEHNSKAVEGHSHSSTSPSPQDVAYAAAQYERLRSGGSRPRTKSAFSMRSGKGRESVTPTPELGNVLRVAAASASRQPARPATVIGHY